MIVPRLMIAGVLLSAAISVSQEKKINRSNLPSAVEKTVAQQSRGATLRGFSEEQENGNTYYEAELTVNGRSKDVLMDKDGRIVEVEEQVAIDSLPAIVRAGLDNSTDGGKLVKVETITKRGKLVGYEGHVLTRGRKFEVQVGPEGRPLNHEE